jgi:glutamate dehydrogenase/leucine dehydrogenase
MRSGTILYRANARIEFDSGRVSGDASPPEFRSDGKVAAAAEPETIVTAKCDVLSPNALGDILDDHTIPRLHGRVIVGAAASRPGTKAAV